jgi:hypothetical protein
VRVGSAEARPAGFTQYLAPGAHEIELYTGTTTARKTRVVLTAGVTTSVALDAETPPPPATTPTSPQPQPPPPKERPHERSFPTAWLIGGAAVTLASCALPLAFALDTGSKRDDANALGTGSVGYADATKRFEDARTRYEISWAVPATFAVATAVIVVVQLLTSDGTDNRPFGLSAAPSARTSGRASTKNDRAWTGVTF